VAPLVVLVLAGARSPKPGCGLDGLSPLHGTQSRRFKRFLLLKGFGMETEKKHRSVRLKDKDLLIFDFVAKFGFANVGQLHTYLGGSLNSLKTRLSHLVNDGYLVNHRIFFGKPSVYTITAKGNRTGLASVKEISVGGYEHDLLVIDVFLKLQSRFVDYATEKMLRAERGVGVGKSGRIPDLVGFTTDGKAIALEVDRTDKSLDRVQKIVNTYAMEFKYQEVWFICANQLIYNNLEKVNFSDKIKLFHLKDVIDGKDLAYVKKSGVSSEDMKIPKELCPLVDPIEKRNTGRDEKPVEQMQKGVVSNGGIPEALQKFFKKK
jgi:hypothetical protein